MRTPHTFDERTKASFNAALHKLLKLKGWHYKQLAERLNCSERTIVNIAKNPLSVSGGYTERIRQLLLEEETL